jgi:hypothetical protein
MGSQLFKQLSSGSRIAKGDGDFAKFSETEYKN